MTGTGPAGGPTLAEAPLINGGVMSAPTPNASLTDSYEPWGLLQAAWWKYIAVDTGYVEFQALAGDGVLVVDADKVELPYIGGWYQVTAGQVIYLAIGTWDDPPLDQSYVLRVSRVQPFWAYATGPVGGDNFADAGELITNVQATYTGPGLTMEPGEPPINSFPSQSAWWTWTAPRNGYARISNIYLGGSNVAVYTGTALNALALVTWSGPNYQGGEVGWVAEQGQLYYVQISSYNEGPAQYAPMVSLVPYVKTVSPVTSVTAQTGVSNAGTVVGGAGALATTSLDSYVSGVSGNPFNDSYRPSYFFLNFSPVTLPPAHERITARFAVVGETSSATDLYTGYAWEKVLNFFGTGTRGNGRSFRIGPLSTTPGYKDRGIDIGSFDWSYTQIETGNNPNDSPTALHLTMSYEWPTTTNVPFKVYYAAWEIYSWGEDEEIAVVQQLLTPMLTGQLLDTGQRFQVARTTL